MYMYCIMFIDYFAYRVLVMSLDWGPVPSRLRPNPQIGLYQQTISPSSEW